MRVARRNKSKLSFVECDTNRQEFLVEQKTTVNDKESTRPTDALLSFTVWSYTETRDNRIWLNYLFHLLRNLLDRNLLDLRSLSRRSVIVLVSCKFSSDCSISQQLTSSLRDLSSR
ncbi:hypothetical protein ANTPLA_LOCUS8518 [Anthophora plagiata]